MKIEAAAFRKDVERTLDLYRWMRIERVGSNMGRFVIDDSRVQQIRTLLRTFYAQPELPRVMGDGVVAGHYVQLRCSAPRRLVVQTIKSSKARQGMRSVAESPRDWTGTIAQRLGFMERNCVECRGHRCIHGQELCAAADIRVALVEPRNIERQCSTLLGSSSQRKWLGRFGLAQWEERLASARKVIEEKAPAYHSIVHRDSYAEAIENFALACASEPEAMAYYFREC